MKAKKTPSPSGTPENGAGPWDCQIRQMFFCVWSVLSVYRDEQGRPLHSAQDAMEVVHAFMNTGKSTIVPLPAASPASLPEAGHNELFLALLPTGTLHLRWFSLEGKLLFDAPVPETAEGVELAKLVANLLNRKRLPRAQTQQIQESVTSITGMGFPGMLATLLANHKPPYTDVQLSHYTFVCLRNFTRDWVKTQRRNLVLPLDSPISGSGPACTLGDRLEDSNHEPPSLSLIRTEEVTSLRLTLEELPDTSRSTLQQHLKSLAQGQKDPSLQSPAGRQRLRQAKLACSVLLALREQSESAEGRARIRLLAQLLLPGGSGQRNLVAHFCEGSLLPEAHSPRGNAMRLHILEAGRVLQPFLDRRSHLALRLLPLRLCQQIEALLTGGPRQLLARQLGCADEDLISQARFLQQDLSLVWEALMKSLSSKGRNALARQIRESLAGAEHSVATAIWLEHRTVAETAATAQLAEESVRDSLLSGLRRLRCRQKASC